MIPEICVAQSRRRKMGDIAGCFGSGRSFIILSTFVNFCFHVKSGEKKIPGLWAQFISFCTCQIILQPVSLERTLGQTGAFHRGAAPA